MCLLNMLLNECMDALAATFIVANLDRLVMLAEMKVGLLYSVIIVDVEDLRVTSCRTFERLFANPIHKSKFRRRWISNKERLLREAIEFGIVDGRGLMGLLKIFAS